MSKSARRLSFSKLAVIALVLGLVITCLSGLYSRKTSREQCSESHRRDLKIECRLETEHRGLPLAYKTSDMPVPDYTINLVLFTFDWIIWSGLSGVGLGIARKKK